MSIFLKSAQAGFIFLKLVFISCLAGLSIHFFRFFLIDEFDGYSSGIPGSLSVQIFSFECLTVYLLVATRDERHSRFIVKRLQFFVIELFDSAGSE